jgi:hypothetical protein
MADLLMHFLRRILLALRADALVGAVLVGGALVAAMLVCTSAGAFAASTTTTTVAESTPIEQGWNVEASVVRCPGQPSRTLTSVQTATFLQSWLPDAFYSHLKVQDPPPGVVRCTVTIPETIEGQAPQPASAVGYASNGTRVWVLSPPGKWSVAKQTQRVIKSFEGHGTYVPLPAIPATTIPGSTTTVAAHTSHKSSSTWVWIAIPVVLVIVVVLALLRSRRRR